MLKLVVLAVVLVVVIHAKNIKSKTLAKRKAGSIHKRQTTSCGPNQFRCTNGQCIQAEWTCDTDRDCFDGSDEVACPTDCSGAHQLQCASGQCIPSEFRCDGIADCYDGTDEICPPNCGGAHKFHCAGQCIPSEFQCDGITDCYDGTDEICFYSCRADQFRCADGVKCINAQWRCDSDLDCHDGSDEGTAAGCVCDPDTQLTCSSGRCLPISWECDGDNDCGDASDEHCSPAHSSLCADMMNVRDCALMNDTSTPICMNEELGFKFCRKFCNLCMTHP